MTTIRILQEGDIAKPDPFTITIVANPALETPIESGTFSRDPIQNDEAGFDAAAGRIVDALFGRVAGQRENIFSDPAMAAAVRIVSLFDSGLPASASNSLAGHSEFFAGVLEPRRRATAPFLARFGLTADISYAVSGSATHTGASALSTIEDQTSPGTPFVLDGVTLQHRDRCRMPGTVAVHRTTGSVEPLHEFQHAISSDGALIVDLYIDSAAPALNNKQQRPIPSDFATYNGTVFRSDHLRHPIGYDPAWTSYHCEPISSMELTLMDDYPRMPAPEQCQNDRITRQFVLERLRVKMNR